MEENEFVPCCEAEHHHPELVEHVKKITPNDEILMDFGDSTRIRILYLLFEEEMCVCDIAQVLDISQSAISHQLRILKQAKLVKFRREGKSIIYSLADDHVRRIINQGMEHLTEG